MNERWNKDRGKMVGRWRESVGKMDERYIEDGQKIEVTQRLPGIEQQKWMITKNALNFVIS